MLGEKMLATKVVVTRAILDGGKDTNPIDEDARKRAALAEASAETALVFGAIGTTLGAIWGRPTWGVYWAWDPRLTTVAILLVAYAGYMALRRFVDDPERRAWHRRQSRRRRQSQGRPSSLPNRTGYHIKRRFSCRGSSAR